MTDELPSRPTIAQAATYLDVEPKTVRRYISRGILRAHRVGPKLPRVDRASLMALVGER